MAGAFQRSSVEQLIQRRESVERSIAYLMTFRDRIDRRIEHLKSRPATAPQSQDPTPPHIEGEP